MPTNSTPSLVTALRKKDAYLDSVSKIRFQETVSSYLFKAGDHFYKIKKADSEHTSLAVKQAFCQEEAKLLHRLNGEELEAEVLPVYQHGKSFSYRNEAGAIAVDYALKTTALSERNLVSHLLDQKKLSLIAVGRIARKLAQVHSDFPANDKTPRFNEIV